MTVAPSIHQEDRTSSHLVPTPPSHLSPGNRTNEDGEAVQRLTHSAFDYWFGADLLTSRNACSLLRYPDRGISSRAIGAVVHVRVTSLTTSVTCLVYIYQF